MSRTIKLNPALASILALRGSELGLSSAESSSIPFLLWIITGATREYHGLVIDRDYFMAISEPVGSYMSRLEVHVATKKRLHGWELEGDQIDTHIWYYSKGVQEFRLAPFVSQRELVQLANTVIGTDADGNGASVLDYATLAALGDEGAQFELGSARGRKKFKRWCEADGAGRVPVWLRLPRHPAHVDHVTGVNLVGYADGVLGLGEDLRCFARTLRERGVPHAVVNVELSPAHATSESNTLAAITVERPVFPINVFCLPLFETERVRVERGANLFSPRYNIGNWPWELTTLPPYWQQAFDAIDEIWAISHFLVGVYGKLTTKPVVYMPPLVTIESVEPFDLAQLGLSPSNFVFLAIFDFNSAIARKNPAGALAAFRDAFPPGGRERLIVKTINGHAKPNALKALQAIIGDDERIVLVDGAYPRPLTSGLIAAVDCFVSLHRAEGFGRVMAEAMLLETAVIATNYSGNTTFLDDFVGFPVDYELVPVPPGDYPYSEGSFWAEPSHDHAVAMMRQVVERPDVVRRKIGNARRRIKANHGLVAVAAAVGKRLLAIEAEGRLPNLHCDSP